MRPRALILALALLSLPGIRAAEARPADVVRSYFEALVRRDYQAAVSLTEGSARDSTIRLTHRMASTIRSSRARVSVKLARLEMQELGAEVVAAYEIRVVGKRWLFSRTRKISGTARFQVIGPRIRWMSRAPGL